jgi:hypothetical protein
MHKRMMLAHEQHANDERGRGSGQDRVGSNRGSVMSNTRTMLPPAGLCPECLGDGQVLAPVRLAFGEDDGLENVTCPKCGGSGRARDTAPPSVRDTKAPAVRDTWPSPPPSFDEVGS